MGGGGDSFFFFFPRSARLFFFFGSDDEKQSTHVCINTNTHTHSYSYSYICRYLSSSSPSAPHSTLHPRSIGHSRKRPGKAKRWWRGGPGGYEIHETASDHGLRVCQSSRCVLAVIKLAARQGNGRSRTGCRLQVAGRVMLRVSVLINCWIPHGYWEPWLGLFILLRAVIYLLLQLLGSNAVTTN